MPISPSLATLVALATFPLGKRFKRVWSAPTTTDRDRKELFRILLEEVVVAVDRPAAKAHLTLRWTGGLLSEIDVSLHNPRVAANRTPEETVDLVRRLAEHYADALIAGVLNRQGRRTATGLRFTANRVSSLRTHWSIPCYHRRVKVIPHFFTEKAGIKLVYATMLAASDVDDNTHSPAHEPGFAEQTLDEPTAALDALAESEVYRSSPRGGDRGHRSTSLRVITAPCRGSSSQIPR